MSLTADKQRICCDGAGCDAETRTPVALRQTLSPEGKALQAAEGWLFIVGQLTARHYCPLCAKLRLKPLAQNAAAGDNHSPG